MQLLWLLRAHKAGGRRQHRAHLPTHTSGNGLKPKRPSSVGRPVEEPGNASGGACVTVCSAHWWPFDAVQWLQGM